MKVLVLAVDDWANTGWRFSRCLKLLGYDVEGFKKNPHPFGYKEQIEVFKSMADVKKKAVESDVIHFIASSFIDTGVDLSKKFVVVNHGGSAYRKSSVKVSKFFNAFVDASLIQSPDLLNLGAKNEHLIYYPIDVNFIKPVFNEVGNKLIVGHFPSNAKLKGTPSILQVVNEFVSKINYVGVRGVDKRKNVIKWEDNLARVAKCDIIIETMNAEMRLNKTAVVSGEWGNTALEAAASGKVLITNTLSKDIYEREYGELPILVANNKDQLRQRLEEVLSMSSKEIMVLKHKMRQWAEDNHSLEATAKRLEDKIYGAFHV